MTTEQIQRTPTGRLVDLKAIVGDLTRQRIDKELSHRIRAAAQGTTVTTTCATDLVATGADTQHE